MSSSKSTTRRMWFGMLYVLYEIPRPLDAFIEGGYPGPNPYADWRTR